MPNVKILTQEKNINRLFWLDAFDCVTLYVVYRKIAQPGIVRSFRLYIIALW